MAQFLMALYDSGKTIFTTADAVGITRLHPSLASNLLHKAAKRGLGSRLKRGLFVIAPSEMGSSTAYFGNPYLGARHLVASAQCFISHGSAMELHRMVWKQLDCREPNIYHGHVNYRGHDISWPC